jgi:hypothetical protein
MINNLNHPDSAPVIELPPQNFGGPVGFPRLTEGYPASCMFRYTEPVQIDVFYIGMGREFVLEMAKRLKKYGFTLVQTDNDLPRDWALDGLLVSVSPRYADNFATYNTTFDQDFVVISVNE